MVKKEIYRNKIVLLQEFERHIKNRYDKSMRKCALLFIVFVVLTTISFSTVGCSDKKPAVDTTTIDTIQSDSTPADSVDNLIAETPMPKAADELFDDFIFNFAANKKLQYKRIVFPLPVYRNGKLVTKMEKNQWKIEHFFMRQGYYTLILDNMGQLDLAKDTTIDHVVIEKIFFKTKKVKQFVFNRVNGQWMLTSLNTKPMFSNNNASFMRFYSRFAVDSAFQVASMNDEVEFTSPDPDNDNKDQTGIITPDQWPDFKPELIPHGILYNIIYGQTYKESNRKILLSRGISNSMEAQMVFKKIRGRWKLVKFNG